ncbi:MAG TPA: hypothetical protein VFA73_02145 [Actinomycetota bacterium]|nr:hypothetical protein [Actinomycetota bacterium]
MILALVGCLLVAVSIGQLARRLPSAGGFYTYAARGCIRPSASWSAGATHSWSPWWRRCCSSSSATSSPAPSTRSSAGATTPGGWCRRWPRP